METFSALLALYTENSPVTGEFSAQRPATRSYDVSFDLCLNKQLRKQSWGWWFVRLRDHYDITVMMGICMNACSIKPYDKTHVIGAYYG